MSAIKAIEKLTRLAKETFSETVTISVGKIGNPDLGIVAVKLEYRGFELSFRFIPGEVDSLPDEVLRDVFKRMAMDLGQAVFMKDGQ